MLTLVDAFDQPRRRTEFILNVVFRIASPREHAPVRLTDLEPREPFFIQRDEILIAHFPHIDIGGHIAGLPFAKIPPRLWFEGGNQFHRVGDLINGHP